MTSRWVRLAGAMFLTMAFAAPACADWLGDFCHDIAQDTKRSCCWPQPFVCPDRQSVREIFVLQVGNGWQRQNILGDYHFDPATGQLTEAGQRKVRWIAMETPPQYRTVYIHISENAQETAARINSTQQYVARLGLAGQQAAVQATTLSEPGWPAERVDIISRKAMSSTPDPRLPKAESTSQSGSGGGSGK